MGKRVVWLVGKGALLISLLLLFAGCTSSGQPAANRSPVGQGARATAIPSLTAALPALPAAWTAYTDPSLGYSLSFPQDAEFTSGTSKAGVYTARLQFNLPGVDGYQGMVVRVEPNARGRGVEQIAQELYRRNLLAEPPADWLQQLSNVTVGGLSGVQLGKGPDFSLIIPYEDHVYIIAPVHDTATSALDPQALALFYRVLASLRIPQ